MIRMIPYFMVLVVLAGGAWWVVSTSRQEHQRITATTVQESPGSRTYFIDQQSGDDGNPGTAETSPWKTLAPVRRATLKPGDQVLLRRGQEWRESLELRSSGTAESPIVIGAYGDGAPPALRGSDIFNTPSDWHRDDEGRWYLSNLTHPPGMLLHDGQHGTRRTSRDDLTAPWDFYFDRARKRLYVHLDQNPAEGAAVIEIPVREFVIGPLEADHITFRELELGHGRNITLLAWDSDGLRVEGCHFSGSPGNHIQFQLGSNDGVVVDSTFDDWNLLHKRAYAIQVIAEQSGPVDIAGCTFTASQPGGGEDHAAIMNDYNGWVRTVEHCTFLGNNGALADEGVVIWRPAATATTVQIRDNRFSELGGTAIMIQELEHYGATPKIAVLRNRIENVCLGDDLDKEALRARQFGAASDVLIAYNLINGTAAGQYPHVGIGIQEAEGLTVANNLIRGVDSGILVKQAVSGLVLRNNLLVENRGWGLEFTASSTGVDSDYNGYFRNAGGDGAGLVAEAHSVYADPRLSGEFGLTSGSPLIDAGMPLPELQQDLALREVPQGVAPDIGVLEFVPTP